MIPEMTGDYIIELNTEYFTAMDDVVSESEEIRRHNLESCRFVFKINRLIDDFNAHCLARKQSYETNAVHLANMASDLKRLFRHKYNLAQAICAGLGEPNLEHEMEEEESEEESEEEDNLFPDKQYIYDPDIQYIYGSIVSFKNQAWRSLNRNKGIEPGTYGWELINLGETNEKTDEKTA